MARVYGNNVRIYIGNTIFCKWYKNARDHATAVDMQPVYESFDDVEVCKRCPVGTISLKEIYGDHCQLTDVLQKIEGEIMKNVKSKHDKQNVEFNNCERIDPTALMLGKALLQDKISKWTEEDRNKGSSGRNWRVGWELWCRMKQRCTGGKRSPSSQKVKEAQEGAKKNNKGSTTTSLGIKDVGSSSKEEALMDDILDDDDKFPSSQLRTMLNAVVESTVTSSSQNRIDVNNIARKVTDAIQEKEGTL
ncbi:SICAvar, type II (fragment) [Plasmodium knowlesi strain H]|uniref:SICAvar, type II n=2 Tax=Plasmodium knowlesi (strain H) TaxID=5851 RepID=A0A5K1UGG3_PLAKH